MDGGVSAPLAGGTGPAANCGHKRRPRDTLRPLVVPPGHACLRLLCHVAHIGGVIGKSGAVVKQLEQETGARIRVDDAVPDCEERVVHVVGPERPRRCVPVYASGRRAGEEVTAEPEVVEVDMSAAQEGVLRVFERALGIKEEVERGGMGGGAGVTCKLLAAMGQVGSLMGRGGKNIDKVRKETGARIRVLRPENLPACASPSDEVVQITGDALAVKKALVAICDCLQNNPSDKAQNVNRTVIGPNVAMPDVRVDHSNRHSFPAPVTSSSFEYTSTDHQAATGVDQLSMSDQKRSQEKVSFRLLCSNDKIGGVIGKGGTIIKALESETGTSIDVGPTFVESEERVITISASESPESQYSPAQNAVVCVFKRSFEVGVKKGLDSGLEKSVIARLLILQGQAGCLMGRGGTIISEIRKSTSTAIRILAGDQVPKCANECEEVVQITGELTNVQNALVNVTGRLRDHIFAARLPKSGKTGSYSSNLPEMPSYAKNTYSPSRSHSYVGPSQTYEPQSQTSLVHSMGNLGLSNSIGPAHSPSSSQANSGLITDAATVLPAFRGAEPGSGSKTAVVTNTTVEIAVAEHLIKFVYGENGTNLNRMRQISGAKVMVHDPASGSREGTVIISGSPDQTLAAQSLLQAFILGGRSSSRPHL